MALEPRPPGGTAAAPTPHPLGEVTDSQLQRETPATAVRCFPDDFLVLGSCYVWDLSAEKALCSDCVCRVKTGYRKRRVRLTGRASSRGSEFREAQPLRQPRDLVDEKHCSQGTEGARPTTPCTYASALQIMTESFSLLKMLSKHRLEPF